jgi:hypothetical protein
MNKALRAGAVIVAALVSLPMIVIASLGLANSLLVGNTWVGVWAFWWLGLGGALALCVGITRSGLELGVLWWPSLLVGIGVYSAAKLDLRSTGDSSGHLSFDYR